MRTTVVLCMIACLTAIFGLLEAAPQEQYTRQFDNVDVDSVLSNNRILNNYIKCLLEKGPCTAEGRELKKLLPDALATDCSKCTDVQRKNSNKVITFLRTHKAAEWKKLLDKYDPKGQFQARLNQGASSIA